MCRPLKLTYKRYGLGDTNLITQIYWHQDEPIEFSPSPEAHWWKHFNCEDEPHWQVKERRETGRCHEQD
jgi:hypothetical protein